MADQDVKYDDNFKPGMLVEADDASRTPTPLQADQTTKRLKVDSNSGNGAASVGDGNVTVTTPGTAVRLIVTSTPCKRVIVHAVSGNIVVGASDVDYTEATRKGRMIYKTQEAEFKVSNVNLLWVDATDASTLCSFYYES